MILIPIEQQAYYLVPSLFVIGYFLSKYCENGAKKGVDKKYRRMCTKHILLWGGMLILLGIVLLFDR